MSIELVDIQQRYDGRVHAEITVDGGSWRVGDIPAELAGDAAAILAHLEGREGDLWADMQRQTYPLAVVTQGEGETQREAWARVLAAGEDDDGVVLSECVGVG